MVLLFHIYTEKQADYYLITNLMVQTCLQTKYTWMPFSIYQQKHHSNVTWSCCRVYIDEIEEHFELP